MFSNGTLGQEDEKRQQKRFSAIKSSTRITR
jgi:hypothetical protein